VKPEKFALLNLTALLIRLDVNWSRSLMWYA